MATVNRNTLIWVGLYLLLTATLTFSCGPQQKTNMLCKTSLQLSLTECILYAKDNSDNYPKKLGDLHIGLQLDDDLIEVMGICKGSGNRYLPSYSLANIDEWMDYFYIYWPEGRKTPSEYPFMYDRRIAHHEDGIQIINNGGNVFFDKNAEWLIKFAKDHPEYSIPLPEDLPGKAEIETQIDKIREDYNIKILNIPPGA